jgi:hypothetical protein
MESISMRLRRFSAAPAALAAALLLAAGCGKTVIDLSKTEDQIQAEAEGEGRKVASVECPSDVEVVPREKFTCTVRLSGGGAETATLLIRDEDANLTLLSLEPAK